MMLAWILSPLGRWLSLLGTVFAAIGIAWLKGRAAGKVAWQTKRQAAKVKAITTTSVIRHDVQLDSDAGLAGQRVYGDEVDVPQQPDGTAKLRLRADMPLGCWRQSPQVTRATAPTAVA